MGGLYFKRCVTIVLHVCTQGETVNIYLSIYLKRTFDGKGFYNTINDVYIA